MFRKSAMHRFAGYGVPMIGNHIVRRKRTMKVSNIRYAVIKIKEPNTATDPR